MKLKAVDAGWQKRGSGKAYDSLSGRHSKIQYEKFTCDMKKVNSLSTRSF
jgi:hypothetical protein